MDRYKIAILSNKLFNKKAFHFPETGSITRVVKYIKYCIANGGIFVADNISLEVLNGAIIEVCRYYDLPLVLDTESAARMFSISYSYKHIYSYNNIPEDKYTNYGDFRNRFVVCYDSMEDSLPDGIVSLVTIYGSEKTEELIGEY